ncbi:MAG TPA: tRNA (N6-isopentenyl adenosine(37)-C2)-methylthiotransferase MiaB, partial [Candidatus Atribacteria bacterium]|nr:tRNA (N6-isopentenyl adenosine(37)-C2)-methylthiotransferase MiaB [Candidatus Atribacteria bacterium]
MNKNDSEYIAGLLNRELGYEILWDGDLKDADLIFVNTCFVREKVKNKIYSIIGKI